MLILSCIQATETEYLVKHGDSVTRIIIWHELNGGIILKNDAGQLDLEAGEFTRAESANSVPLSAPMPDGVLDWNVDVVKI